MKFTYNLVLLRASSATNFPHIIKENQRLNGAGAPLTTLWFRAQKYVRDELSEPFRLVLAMPTELGIDFLGDCTELHPENPLFTSHKILDLNGQIAVSAQPTKLQPCPYGRSADGNDWDDGLTEFTNQTHVELFYDVEKNTGIIYRATDTASGEQLALCLGDDVRGYGPIRLDVLPEELRRCPNLVTILPKFDF